MEKKNLYAEITDRIIKQLEKGTIPWHKPWIIRGDGVGIVSHSTGKGYSLLNAMLLEEEGEYATFNQIKAEGGNVKNGAKAKPIYFWKQLAVKVTDEKGKPILNKDGKPLMKKIPLLKYYSVFNILTDAENIKPKYYGPSGKEKQAKDSEKLKIKKAEKVSGDYMKREKLPLRNGMVDSAHYRPSSDSVQVPPITTFEHKEQYYSTLFHELTHSTGAENRLDRPTMRNYHKDISVRATEELIAEIGAATSLMMLGIDTDKSLTNSAAYVKSWLRFLKDDPKMVVTAAGKAEKAVDMIWNIKHEVKQEA